MKEKGQKNLSRFIWWKNECFFWEFAYCRGRHPVRCLVVVRSSSPTSAAAMTSSVLSPRSVHAMPLLSVAARPFIPSETSMGRCLVASFDLVLNLDRDCWLGYERKRTKKLEQIYLMEKWMFFLGICILSRQCSLEPRIAASWSSTSACMILIHWSSAIFCHLWTSP